ncbi:hypothetical protein K443DRAFT_671925 [Laccaria amethystina LaAM-08-1]|uniref:Uncharacterized protein n=1 Tax=Laccaria amethystina LaAM-08-1 TaxID=1095629 RepID=A0A0C9YEJ2_9AGAR|nr:hypothetical protein K443DRAFT_671925 [Laccaria amethystina LaAM-08-1]
MTSSPKLVLKGKIKDPVIVEPFPKVPKSSVRTRVSPFMLSKLAFLRVRFKTAFHRQRNSDEATYTIDSL